MWCAFEFRSIYFEIIRSSKSYFQNFPHPTPILKLYNLQFVPSALKQLVNLQKFVYSKYNYIEECKTLLYVFKKKRSTSVLVEQVLLANWYGFELWMILIFLTTVSFQLTIVFTVHQIHDHTLMNH